MNRSAVLAAGFAAATLVAASAALAGHPLEDAPKDRSGTERVLRAPATLAELPFRLLGGGLERTLAFVERTDPIGHLRGLPPWLAENHLILGDGGQGTGSGIGVAGGVFARPGGVTISATTAWTIRGYRTHAARIAAPVGSIVALSAWARDRLRTEDGFYGIGPGSRGEDEVEYEQRNRNAGAALTVRGRRAELRLDGDWTDWGRSVPAGGSLDAFAGAAGAELAGAGIRLTIPVPLHGGGSLREAGAEIALRSSWDVRGESFGFTSALLTLHGAIPIDSAGRALAARMRVATASPHSGREIPFWLLPSLDSAFGHRALETFRFRDRDAALLNLEYRFPVWDIGLPGGVAMDGALFWDGGLVSPRLEDHLRTRDVKTGWGAGLRVRSFRATIARFHVAFAGGGGWRMEWKVGRDY